MNSSDEIYSVNITKGYGKLAIENLTLESHIATVSYNGDDIFKPAENSTTFTVEETRADPNLSIKVNGIYSNQKAVAVVSANKTLNGMAELRINGSDRIFPIQILILI